MKKFILFISCVFIGLWSQAQSNKELKKSVKITYKSYLNGKENTDARNIIVVYNNKIVQVYEDKGDKKYIPEMPKEISYIDYSNSKIYQTAEFINHKRISVINEFSKLAKFEITQEKEQILGFNCQKAQATLFSNKIEIWVTDEAGFSGSPSINYLFENKLVLKVVRNGNSVILADKLEYPNDKNIPDLLPQNWGDTVDQPTFRRRVSESYIKLINVFDHEQINWGNTITNPTDENALNLTFKYAGGTVILKKIKLPEVADDANVFAEVVQYSNGDAYDRTGCVFLIPTDKKQSFLDALRKGIKEVPGFSAKNGKTYNGFIATLDFLPIVELIRFYTPFGVKHFNDKVKMNGIKWADSSVYKQDITELLPSLKGEVWVGAFIGNYDKGGHILNFNLKYHLNEIEIKDIPKKDFWISPLFSTTNVMEMAGQEYGTFFGTDTLTVSFTVPENVKNVRFRYISTGHGGWENGDEFVPKKNEVYLDEKLILGYAPWRTDCGTYRQYNPASGNFFNGLSSSDYSRSGWCPGTTTNPVFINIDNLTSGTHTIKVHIPQGANEGGSFSSWCISGVLIGEKYK